MKNVSLLPQLKVMEGTHSVYKNCRSQGLKERIMETGNSLKLKFRKFHDMKVIFVFVFGLL